MTDRHAPIMIFDSGVGGLSVHAEVRRLMPHAPIVYAADYAAMPYGDKDESAISARVPAILGRLAERFHPSLICIACNTASTIALPAVRAALDIPIVGTVPAVKPAAKSSRTRVIGLLGTEATIRQAYVDKLHAEFAADTRLIRHGAPALVLAAEALLKGEAPPERIFDEAIQGLLRQDGGDIDTIILACTHFPLVRRQLAEAGRRAGLSGALTFVDGSEGIARRIADLSSDRLWPEIASPGRFITTGAVEAMSPYLPALKERGLIEIETL